MSLNSKQFDQIETASDKEDFKKVEVEDLEDTPMEVYHNRFPTGGVYVFDGDDLVYNVSKVMEGGRSAKSRAASSAKMYALGAEYIDEF